MKPHNDVKAALRLFGFDSLRNEQIKPTAMEQLQQLKSAKMRQRAECLLQLCSRKKSLDKAINAMQEELEIKRSAVDRVIKKLKGLGLSPITIPIRRHAEPLPSLLTLLG